MSAPGTPSPPPPVNPQTKIPQPDFLEVAAELDLNREQLVKRQTAIRDIEALLSARHNAQNRLISYIARFGHPRASMSSADIAPLETILNSTTGAEQLNVILHSPGGDGTIVEKMVEMCRAHISGPNKKLRVIVPNLAKSAATVFSLGADKIIMGYCSELGPIDPQVQVAISGVIHWVSALAFVESRDRLVFEINEAMKNNQPTTSLLQQLASLNIPFTQEMENQIEFAEKTATRLLEKYMLVASTPHPRTRHAKAKRVAAKLVSKILFPVHGHFINAAAARNQLNLDVDILERDDELWKLIWKYYIRAEVQMNLQVQPPLVKIKLYESQSASMVTQDTAN